MSKKERSRHGLKAVMARVKVVGWNAIDMRSAAAQSMVAWRNELVRDLGGPEALSAQRMAIVDAVVRTKLYIDHLDQYLASQKSLVNKRKKAIVPALQQRQSLVDSWVRLLSTLGLDRVPIDGGALPAEWVQKVKPVEQGEVPAAVTARSQERARNGER
jgi:hypothetical protein